MVTPVRVDPTGALGPTPDQARGPRWRRTSRGFYVPAAVDGDRIEQRIVEAASGIPGCAAVTGWAALHWLGAKWFEGYDAHGHPRPVDIALGDNRTMAPRSGVRISERWVPGADVIEVDGLRITTPAFATWVESSQALSFTKALTVVDMVVGQDLASLSELTDYTLGRCVGRPGIRRFRSVLAQADENVWSPQETPMRLLWIEVTGQNPLCNTPIFDLHGRHLVTPDVFDPIRGVAGEYDGLHHLVDGRRRRDLVREEIYRSHGIEVVTMMTQDRRDRSDFKARLRSAYSRSLGPCEARTWTTEMPPSWKDTTSVEARRALRGIDREIWLRRGAS